MLDEVRSGWSSIILTTCTTRSRMVLTMGRVSSLRLALSPEGAQRFIFCGGAVGCAVGAALIEISLRCEVLAVAVFAFHISLQQRL